PPGADAEVRRLPVLPGDQHRVRDVHRRAGREERRRGRAAAARRLSGQRRPRLGAGPEVGVVSGTGRGRPRRRRAAMRWRTTLAVAVAATLSLVAAAVPAAAAATESYVLYYTAVGTYQGSPETLWTIAGRFLGDADRAGELLDLNSADPQPDGARLTDPAIVH